MENNMLKKDACDKLLKLLSNGLNVEKIHKLVWKAQEKAFNEGKLSGVSDVYEKFDNDITYLETLKENGNRWNEISIAKELSKDEVSEIINKVIKINDYWRKYMPNYRNGNDNPLAKPLYDIDKINDFLEKNNMEKIERTEDHEVLANSGNKHGVDASHFQSYASVNDSSLDDVTNVYFAEKSNVDKESNEVESDNLHLMEKNDLLKLAHKGKEKFEELKDQIVSNKISSEKLISLIAKQSEKIMSIENRNSTENRNLLISQIRDFQKNNNEIEKEINSLLQGSNLQSFKSVQLDNEKKLDSEIGSKEKKLDSKSNLNMEQVESIINEEKGESTEKEEEENKYSSVRDEKKEILTKEIIEEYFKVVNLDSKIKQLEEFYETYSEIVPIEFKGNEEKLDHELKELKKYVDELTLSKNNLENVDNISEKETNELEKALTEMIRIRFILDNCGLLTDIEKIKVPMFLRKNKLYNYIDKLNILDNISDIPDVHVHNDVSDEWRLLREKIISELGNGLLENDLRNALIDCLKDSKFEDICLKVKNDNDLTESENEYLINKLNSSVGCDYYNETWMNSIVDAIKNIDIANKESKTSGSFKSTDNENIELIDFIKRLKEKLENQEQPSNVTDKAKLETNKFRLGFYLECLAENKKFSDRDVANFQKIIDDYPELVNEIVSDENFVNDIKNDFSKLASSEKKKDDNSKDEQSDSKTINSVSNEQIGKLIEDLLGELNNFFNSPDDASKLSDAMGGIITLEKLKQKIKSEDLDLNDLKNLKDIFKFVEENITNSNVLTEENKKIIEEIDKSLKHDNESNAQLADLIDAMMIDLENISNNTEMMANNQEAYDNALSFMSDLSDLRERAVKNELEARDIETISKTIQFIKSFENEHVKDFEINKDKFKDIIDGFKEEALHKDLVSFIDEAIKKIDDELDNVKGTKKFNLDKAAYELAKLSEKIKDGNNITDKDVKKFRKVLNNDSVQEILDLSDEEKERYIKALESLVDKEKDRKDNQINDGQRGAGEEPDADELGVAKIEKDKKTYLKALAGVAGFAFGAVLGYAVPFPAGLVVTYGIQAVKIATRIASHSLAGKDNKITKVINVAKEKFPRINKFIKSSYVKWAFNGFTLGYTAGTIANKIHKPNLDKTAGGDNSKPHHTPDGTTATDKIPATDKTPATDGIVHDPTGVGDEPENIVTSLQKGDRWNIRKVADGYGYDSSTMDRRVHLDKDFTNDVIIGKSKIVDGEKMVLVKDNKTKEALAWLKESDILNQGRKR